MILAIDGGNSKTDVAVLTAGGEVLATTRGGGFRPVAEGVTHAVDTVAEAVTRALSAAGAGPVLDHVSAYLANVDLPVEEQEFHRLFTERGWGRTVQVGNDTFALLRAGTTEHWGVAVVCGAGINCAGVAPDGRVARFPSIGRVTGDWGGGHHLGEEALWHAVRAEDGRGPHTALAAAVAAHFGSDSAGDVGLAIHFGEISEGRLGELSPVLFAVAAEGDPVARGLVDRQAEEVVALATVALRRLDLLDVPVEVVLGGGVLAARHPQLMSAIEDRLAELAPQAKLLIVEAPPLLGAALLGLDATGAPPEAYDRLRAHFGKGVAPAR
ncbi:ATPase [Actinoallomurus purpureus]|uniref:N-acetylglucosamine kinase n=1 Tax=Actinoallomurus purpureus TaxID=478114 RepID=UPI0020926355|nr:BadF/BadG/BcrA/BcrD ATPase family protein [Actinoallomurus purpureus]MCO6004232.1 ATPase [Actinoallomurus purpureus]